MRGKILAFMLIASAIAVLGGCNRAATTQVQELKRYPLDSPDGLITQTGVQTDKETSADGKGSLKITSEGPAVVRLYETGDLNVENARLIYQAKVKTEKAEGKVYLEMWCHFPGKGEFFSRGLDQALTGTMNWSSQETMFLLKKGEKPDNIKLNLVMEGRGTAWIDDIRLLKGAL